MHARYFPLACCAAFAHASAQSPDTAAKDFAERARKLREAALVEMEPRIDAPSAPRSLAAYRWKQDIVTTIIAVGETKDARRSAWDEHWMKNFGGIDAPDPAQRRDFRPNAFVPRLNPFYCALPYNDVSRNSTKAEAESIPWFKSAFIRPGLSICQNHWVAIRNRRNSRVAYAQWSDCGPFSTDAFSYVFGSERPKPNAGGGAGLSVAPAVRDYLGLGTTDVTDWRFVEVREVPAGPWRKFGDNNPFVQAADHPVKAP